MACDLGDCLVHAHHSRTPRRSGKCRQQGGGRAGVGEGSSEEHEGGAGGLGSSIPTAEEQDRATMPGCARSRRRLSRRPPHHLKTDGNVGQSGDFIFFMNFLNSLFFLSHL